jgi:hypothetical protein
MPSPSGTVPTRRDLCGGGRYGVADHAGAGLRAVPIERLRRFVRRQSLDSTDYEAFVQFTAAIDRCLDGLPTVHKREMETLMIHKIQMFGNVPLLAA